MKRKPPKTRTKKAPAPRTDAEQDMLVGLTGALGLVKRRVMDIEEALKKDEVWALKPGSLDEIAAKLCHAADILRAVVNRKPIPQDDFDVADETEDDLADQINTEGETVFDHDWDGGGMGASGGYSVHRWKGRFAVSSVDECENGPFDTLDDALAANALLLVTSATTKIRCSLLSAAKLAKMLEFDDGIKGPFELYINDVLYTYRGKGKLQRSPKKR
jgi:hypothetical protein